LEVTKFPTWSQYTVRLPGPAGAKSGTSSMVLTVRSFCLEEELQMQTKSLGFQTAVATGIMYTFHSSASNHSPYVFS